MFSGIGWGEILALLVVGLFVLGPERLPEAMAWLGRTIRKVRDFATGAQDQLRKDMGPDFDEFRKPLEEIQNLRNVNPKRAIRQQVFDGDSDPLGVNTPAPSARKPGGGAAPARKTGQGTVAAGLTAGEKPPVDPDAT